MIPFFLLRINSALESSSSNKAVFFTPANFSLQGNIICNLIFGKVIASTDT
jgi:hypothetical protein